MLLFLPHVRNVAETPTESAHHPGIYRDGSRYDAGSRRYGDAKPL